MNLIEKSLEIALKAHRGQKDKMKKEFILHPLRVMAKMDTDIERSAAILHDVIEDSDVTAKDLLKEGIPEEVVKAVNLLTNPDGADYEAYVLTTRTNTLARKVKLADLEDNLDAKRLETMSDMNVDRLKKYHSAWKKLKENK